MLKGVLLISLLELLPDAVLAMKCEKLDEFLFQKIEGGMPCSFLVWSHSIEIVPSKSDLGILGLYPKRCFSNSHGDDKSCL